MMYINETKEKNKYFILEFSTTWCMPCKVLETKVLQNDSVNIYLKQRAALLSVDAEKGMGMALAMKYGITAYPTLLIFDSSQTVIDEKIGIDGIGDPPSFIAFLNSIFEGKNTLPAIGLRPELLKASAYPEFYVRWMKKKIHPDSTVLINYFRKQQNPFSAINWAIIRVFDNDSLQSFVEHHAGKYINLYGCMATKLFSKKIKDVLDNTFKTKDTAQFKNIIIPYLKTLENLSPTQLAYREYLIKLNFWSKAGPYWDHFLSCWHAYRSTYGNDLDIKAAEYIDERCNKWTVRRFAQYILAQALLQNPHDLKTMVGLANLWEKDRFSQPEGENTFTIHAATPIPFTPNPDSLYKQAIKEAGGDERKINLVVGGRLQAAYSIADENGWLSALHFFRKYMPEAYRNFHNSESATYYKKQGNWGKFAIYANKAFRREFIEAAGYSVEAKKINAHNMYIYANIIEKNGETAEQIEMAVSWMEYLAKKFPDVAVYQEEKKALEKKKSLFTVK